MSAILVNDKEKHTRAQEIYEENLKQHHSMKNSNSIDNNVATQLSENDKGSTTNIISTSEATPLGNF